DGQDDRTGQEILDIGHIRINLDDGKRCAGGGVGERRLLVVSGEQTGDGALEAGRGKLIRVVLDERDVWIESREHLPGKLRRDVQYTIDFARAQILQGGGEVFIGGGIEGARVGGDRLKHFLHFHGRNAVILIDYAEMQILNDSAEGVPEDDELHERHD